MIYILLCHVLSASKIVGSERTTGTSHPAASGDSHPSDLLHEDTRASASMPVQHLGTRASFSPVMHVGTCASLLRIRCDKIDVYTSRVLLIDVTLASSCTACSSTGTSYTSNPKAINQLYK